MSPNDDEEDFGMPVDFIIPAPHLGTMVASEPVARGLTVSRASLMMRMPQSRLARIVAGERSITAESALRPKARPAGHAITPKGFLSSARPY